MPNVFLNLPMPLGLNGPGASVDVSTMGASKSLVVGGQFPRATVTVEASIDGTYFAPVAVFSQGQATRVVPVGANWMRVNVSGRTAGTVFTATADVGAPGETAQFGSLALPVLNGPGAPLDVSALPEFFTFICSGPFVGAAILVEASEDGSSWAALAQFSGNGGIQTRQVTPQFLRVNVSGRKTGTAFNGMVNFAATTLPTGSPAEETCDCPGTGARSTRVGVGALANNDDTTAVGFNAMATGLAATAVGKDSVASNTNATAYGHGASATEPASAAIGANSNAGALNATAAGVGASALGVGATAVGHEVLAASDHSTIVGAESTDGGADATVLGWNASAGTRGTALGTSSSAASDGIAIGDQASANSKEAVINNGPPAGANSLDTFRVVGLEDDIIKAVRATVDISPAGGAVGIFISVDRTGTVAAEQVFCGAAGTGPGGVGRALYIVD